MANDQTSIEEFEKWLKWLQPSAAALKEQMGPEFDEVKVLLQIGSYIVPIHAIEIISGNGHKIVLLQACDEEVGRREGLAIRWNHPIIGEDEEPQEDLVELFRQALGRMPGPDTSM